MTTTFMPNGSRNGSANGSASLSSAVSPVVQWVTASPLWGQAAADPAQMQRPALLRFATDAFMETLTAVVQSPQPEALAGYLAAPASYQARPVGAPAAWQPPLAHLKLYQPVHGHFNLVAASLVCRLPGMPDRFVDTANAEKTSFVLRRLHAGGGEMAWIAEGANKGWQALTPDAEGDFRFVVEGEELLPLAPVLFAEERRRRLLIGLIPTESRDTYVAQAGASALTPDPAQLAAEDDPRLDEAGARVIGPLQALIGQTSAKAGEKEASRFLLLDLAEFLQTNASAAWAAIADGPRPAAGPARDLYDTLQAAVVDTAAAPGTTWRGALKTALAEWERISGDSTSAPSQDFTLRRTTLNPNTLRANLDALLRTIPLPAAPVPATVPTAGRVEARELPKLDGNPNTRYVLRCVYQRPHCGPLQPDVVSAPAAPFGLAPFFDFDAPSRPIRISLPVDTSIKGLRKFNKNVGFLLSDQLRRQMSSVTDLKAALDGNLAAGESFDLGVICSFSIPIITICALIVLIIFIYLLNIVFWWLPFFRICLPIGLKKE